MTFRSFSKRQMLALTWWNRPGLGAFEGLLCDGAIRSGKTVCMSVGFFLWSMSRFDHQVFGICGKTIGALQRNILEHLPGWLGPEFRLRQVRSQNKLVVTHRNGACNTYYLFGGQDEGAAALIQGITLAGVLLDEAALLPRSFLEQACARCSVPGSKLWFNCNPEGPEHWFYKEWVCKAREKGLLRLRFTMDDNPGLEQAIRQRYETMYTGVFRRRFVLGQWCQAQGLVYDFSREKHIVDTPPPGGKYYISVDYGTQNPFSAGLWQVRQGRAVRLREFYHNGREEGRQLTDQEYCQKLEELAGDCPVEQVIVDPSAASFIAALRAGGRFSVRKARNTVADGIRLVASCLQQGRIAVTGCCRDCIREFGLYRWEEGRDVPRKENDHAMDDVRYFCMAVMRRGGE